MAMTEDLSVFFDQNEFAVSAVHTPSGGSAAQPAAVLYDANGTILEQYGVQTLQPAAVCPATQWPTLAEGDALSITLPAGAVGFRVRSVQPVEDGALKLLTLART